MIYQSWDTVGQIYGPLVLVKSIALGKFTACATFDMEQLS
jgi:hypothetical protein